MDLEFWDCFKWKKNHLVAELHKTGLDKFGVILEKEKTLKTK